MYIYIWKSPAFPKKTTFYFFLIYSITRGFPWNTTLNQEKNVDFLDPSNMDSIIAPLIHQGTPCWPHSATRNSAISWSLMEKITMAPACLSRPWCHGEKDGESDYPLVMTNIAMGIDGP